MELPVPVQLQELGLALALGGCFGLLYRLMGFLRRSRILTALADLAYITTILISLLAFTLYAGRGRLRLFALAAMAISGGLCLLCCKALGRKMKKIAK